jgi:hypothetical protein
MIFWLCLAAPLLYLANSWVLGMAVPGYSARSQAMSSLVHTAHGNWQTANFIICGLLILYLAYLARGMEPGHWHNQHLIWMGVLVLGITLVLLGLIPSDPAGITTVRGQMHGAIFIVSVLVQATLQIVFALSNMPSGLGMYLLASGVITAMGLPAMMLWPDWRGVAQRILVGAIMLWVTLGVYVIRK